MKKILGYKLKNISVEKLDLPDGAKIVSVMDFNGEPTLFAMIDGNETKTEGRIIHRIETGFPQDDKVSGLGFIHIGSITIANYGRAYHFYEERPFQGVLGDCQSGPGRIVDHLRPVPPRAILVPANKESETGE